MIFKPQSNSSGLYVNDVTLRSNRSLNRDLNRNLTAAVYILTMVTLRKLLRFEPQQSDLAITVFWWHTMLNLKYPLLKLVN